MNKWLTNTINKTNISWETFLPGTVRLVLSMLQRPCLTCQWTDVMCCNLSYSFCAWINLFAFVLAVHSQLQCTDESQKGWKSCLRLHSDSSLFPVWLNHIWLIMTSYSLRSHINDSFISFVWSQYMLLHFRYFSNLTFKSELK